MGTKMPQTMSMEVMLCPAPRFVSYSCGIIGDIRALALLILPTFLHKFVEMVELGFK